jgi:hypothetical protein
LELIRNCSHFSLTQCYLAYDDRGQPQRIIKTAFGKEGTAGLINEYAGNVWYAEKRSIDPQSVVALSVHDVTFARLELDYHQGQCGDPALPILKSEDRLSHAIAHYIDAFGPSGFQHAHGDYSLENLVFDGANVVWVLDWEHFNASLPQGFDPLYMLMEAAFFSHRKKNLRRRDIEAAWKLIRHLDQIVGVPDAFFSGPARHLRVTLLLHREVFGRQLMKYPFVNCDARELDQLDALFLAAS